MELCLRKEYPQCDCPGSALWFKSMEYRIFNNCYFLCEAFFLIKVVSCVIMKIKLLEDI